MLIYLRGINKTVTFDLKLITKTMKTATRKSTSTTERGTVLTLSVSVTKGYETIKEISYCDGDNVEIETKKEINKREIILTVNGKDYKGFLTNAWEPKNPIAFVANGNQSIIPVSERVYNELNKAVIEATEEAETDESWTFYQELKAIDLKEEIEYNNHVKAVENMMTLNGKTY